MQRFIPFVQNEMYHLYNRGVDKRTIFLDDSDHFRFLLLLYFCNSKDPVHLANTLSEYQGRSLIEVFGRERTELLVDIGAYCLMPNHFHILVREKSENGVSQFMGKLGTAYSMYFNKRYERTGALFSGRFKAKHVDNEAYLNWLFSYIHLNPVKLIAPNWKEKGITNLISAKKFVNAYKYSSYHDYFIGTRAESRILSKNTFPRSFEDLDDFSELARVWNGMQENRSQY